MCSKVDELAAEIEAVTTLLSNAYNALKATQASIRVLNVEVDKAYSLAQPPLFERLMTTLQHPEFKYRATSTLVDTLGASRADILHELDSRRIAYKILHRRGDGAELIGLVGR